MLGGGGRGRWEISVLSVHFCSESKTIKSVFKNGIKSQEAWEDGQGGQCPRAEKRTKDRRGCIHEEGEAEVGPANVTGGTLGARGILGAAGRRRRRGREGCGASAASRRVQVAAAWASGLRLKAEPGQVREDRTHW